MEIEGRGGGGEEHGLLFGVHCSRRQGQQVSIHQQDLLLCRKEENLQKTTSFSVCVFFLKRESENVIILVDFCFCEVKCEVRRWTQWNRMKRR